MIEKNRIRTLQECPVIYFGDAYAEWTDLYQLWNDTPWERRNGAPRHEYWMNDYGMPYMYGSGDGARTYDGHSWLPIVNRIRLHLNRAGFDYDCCFMNGYLNEKDALGWHADDSPEMDMDHPIAVVSFGAEREIWFRRKGEKGETPYGIKLENGSVLMMQAGMQRDWDHRIPKHPQPCGARISLTFRKLITS